MWEPVGPLPASVYWRRRWLAIAAVLSVLVLLAWGVGALAGAIAAPRGDGTTSLASRPAAVSAPQQASPSPAAPAAPLPQPGTEGPPTPQSQLQSQPQSQSQPEGAPPSPVDGPPSATVEGGPDTSTATSSPSGTSEGLVPDDTPRATSPVPSPAPVPPTGPVACTNEMLAVAAEVDRPEHRVGERPLLRLVVTNVSDQPCVRDLDPERQEIVVWSADGSERLWSSNDCSNAQGVDLRTLVPGQPVASSVRWAGRTSEPGCPLERSTVPAGDYRVMSRVDDVISPPTPFVRRP
ncbi:hypothetical protein [Pseudonocardia kunmingensis]|uniref:MucR family transcriptional regulator n=1 Tax=Pseudonocardia kunmingensis TaxID=630975 RepID=A0A543E2J9_9PSEU|nr:hypothetical protein [Pseudonocardia kunmingensis]TQM15802.1 hypothetical protein FB558_2595 [Pseudonocardia kunmingensis]